MQIYGCRAISRNVRVLNLCYEQRDHLSDYACIRMRVLIELTCSVSTLGSRVWLACASIHNQAKNIMITNAMKWRRKINQFKIVSRSAYLMQCNLLVRTLTDQRRAFLTSSIV